ncbi:MAG: glycerol-3-phosphate 1-O-acyltransferase PlsY [Pseudomonadota bacterium]
MTITLVLVAALSYLLGAIPFGLVIVRMAGLGDIREIGSGNIGATNVLRTGRKDLAAATFALDSGKGAIAVLLAGALTGGSTLAMALAGASAFLGHLFPVFLKFKGGKGVATYFGTLLALWPIGLVVAALAWLGVAFTLRYSSLAALVAATVTPIAFFVAGKTALFLAVLFMTILIFVRHQQNIARLLDGSEPKIGKR